MRTPSDMAVESSSNYEVGLDADMDAGCNMYDTSNSLQEGSPRSKRRRMLLFPGTTEESTIAETSFDPGLDSSYAVDFHPSSRECKQHF